MNVDYPAIGNDGRTAITKGAFFQSLSLFMSQRQTWPRFAGVLWRGLTNIGPCFEVHRFIQLPQFAETAKNNPKFAFRFLFHRYLARRFTVTERASCFLYHYRYLLARLSDHALQQILDTDVLLCEFPDCDHRILLTIGSSRSTNREGELSLNLQVDSDIIFVLSFSIVPGRVVKSEAVNTLLITRIQGARGHYSQISFATKALHDVAPCALLFAALQGVADALEIGEIAGVCATEQSRYTPESAAIFKLNYDDFFSELGMAKSASGFFLSDVPIKGKPLAAIKRGHKLRTKEKRAFKRQIAEDVCRQLRERLTGRGTESLCAERTVELAAVLES